MKDTASNTSLYPSVQPDIRLKRKRPKRRKREAQASPPVAVRAPEPRSGNRCGHDPANPLLTPLRPAGENGKKPPLLLRRMAERLKDYFKNPNRIPSLNLANGSMRRQRSERRESCVRVLTVLVKFLNIENLCVCIPQRDPVTGAVFYATLTAELIAAHTGFPLRRVTRALSDLRKAGILTSSQPRKRNADGSYTGLPALRAISKELFTAFGLGSMLAKERAKRKRPRTQKEREIREMYAQSTQAARARSGLMLKAMFPRAFTPAVRAGIERPEPAKPGEPKPFILRF